MPEKKRILTGTRPTGPLHLGHNAGALENWLELQSEYDCYFLIADYQDSDFMQMTFDAFVTKWYPVRAMPPRGAKKPVNVEANQVAGYLCAESDAAEASDLKDRNERHGANNAELKDRLPRVPNELIEPIRQLRAHYEGNLARVREALEHGTWRARAIARETMEMVHDALDLDYLRQYR